MQSIAVLPGRICLPGIGIILDAPALRIAVWLLRMIAVHLRIDQISVLIISLLDIKFTCETVVLIGVVYITQIPVPVVDEIVRRVLSTRIVLLSVIIRRILFARISFIPVIPGCIIPVSVLFAGVILPVVICRSILPVGAVFLSVAVCVGIVRIPPLVIAVSIRRTGIAYRVITALGIICGRVTLRIKILVSITLRFITLCIIALRITTLPGITLRIIVLPAVILRFITL